jgi:hypothetical protein
MKPMGTLLVTVGGILAGIGLIWGVVIGYYPSEVPALLGTLGSGLLLLFIGSRMIASTKPTKVEWRPTPPPVSLPVRATAPPVASVPADSVPAPVEPAAVTESAVAPQITPAAQPAPSESAAVPVAEHQHIDDATVAVPRRRRSVRWTLHLPAGATALVREEVLLGRAPQPTVEHPQADLIIVDDPSVSESHAVLRLVGGSLQVRDLDSTNGTVFVVGDVEQQCAAGVWMTVPDGATLELGTAEVLCSLASSREVAP